jgi:hypothetical protein
LQDAGAGLGTDGVAAAPLVRYVEPAQPVSTSGVRERPRPVEEAPLKYLILIYGNPASGRCGRQLFLDLAALVVVIVAWFAILFTGRYPGGTFDFVEGVIRWHNRVIASALVLVTDRYPPFRLAQ